VICSTGGRARTDTVLSHHRILSLALLVHSILTRPGIWLIYAGFSRFLRLRCPARTGLYWPGCSTVAVRMRPAHRDSRWLSGPGEVTPGTRTARPPASSRSGGLHGLVMQHQELLGLEGERGIGTALVVGELDLEYVRANDSTTVPTCTR
jgi:hypothetical protein